MSDRADFNAYRCPVCGDEVGLMGHGADRCRGPVVESAHIDARSIPSPAESAFHGARAAAEIADLRARLAAAEAKPSVENCMAERAEGNGGCGACALCCKEQRERAEAAEARERELEMELSVARSCVPWQKLAAAEARVVEVEKERAADRDAFMADINARAEALDAERAAHAETRRERDLAVAHDRQPYPTAEAYEKACAALEKHRQRAEAAEERVRGLRREVESAAHVMSMAASALASGGGVGHEQVRLEAAADRLRAALARENGKP